jgi:chain length determinant protein tyrosine kinase EpsG
MSHADDTKQPPVTLAGEPEIAESSSDDLERQLIRVGRLTTSQVARIKKVQAARRISFFDAAVSIGAVSRESLMSALSKQYSYPIISNETDIARFSRKLVVGYEPFGPVAEAVRSIRTALVASAISNGTRSFVIVGPREATGKTFIAANLALAFAQMSVSTLLVDANLRTPGIAEIFGLARNTVGLSEMLSQQNAGQLPIVYDVMPRLSVLGSGNVPPNPQELLCSPQFVTLTESASREFGVVIYDTPSAMEYADAHVLSGRVGAAIIVARKHKTKFGEVSLLSDKLKSINCNVVGSILNEF